MSSTLQIVIVAAMFIGSWNVYETAQTAKLNTNTVMDRVSKASMLENLISTSPMCEETSLGTCHAVARELALRVLNPMTPPHEVEFQAQSNRSAQALFFNAQHITNNTAFTAFVEDSLIAMISPSADGATQLIHFRSTARDVFMLVDAPQQVQQRRRQLFGPLVDIGKGVVDVGKLVGEGVDDISKIRFGQSTRAAVRITRDRGKSQSTKALEAQRRDLLQLGLDPTETATTRAVNTGLTTTSL